MRGERVVGTVRVHGRERAVVSGVAGLQHVERLAPADLADDDAIGSHAQRAAHEIAHADRAGSLGVRGPGLEPHDVRLDEPQLGRLLDRDDAFARGRSRAASALQHVVLPELVAPETTRFHPARTSASK